MYCTPVLASGTLMGAWFCDTATTIKSRNLLGAVQMKFVFVRILLLL